MSAAAAAENCLWWAVCGQMRTQIRWFLRLWTVRGSKSHLPYSTNEINSQAWVECISLSNRTCKPAWREWKRRWSLIVLDAVTDSNAAVMTRRSLSLPPWSLAPPRPSHDCYSRESTGLSSQTRHCAVSLYITSSLAASLSLPAIVTDSLVKPATDHPSGVEAG